MKTCMESKIFKSPERTSVYWTIIYENYIIYNKLKLSKYSSMGTEIFESAFPFLMLFIINIIPSRNELLVSTN